MTTEADIKECCKDPANLVPSKLTEDLEVFQCKKCSCRHFELTIDAGNMGALGSTL